MRVAYKVAMMGSIVAEEKEILAVARKACMQINNENFDTFNSSYCINIYLLTSLETTTVALLA